VSDASRSRSRCAGLAAEGVLDRFRRDTVVSCQVFYRLARIEALRQECCAQAEAVQNRSSEGTSWIDYDSARALILALVLDALRRQRNANDYTGQPIAKRP